MPSEWYENQPMVILEAFASGTPVIASALGGMPELVADGETGLLYRQATSTRSQGGFVGGGPPGRAGTNGRARRGLAAARFGPDVLPAASVGVYGRVMARRGARCGPGADRPGARDEDRDHGYARHSGELRWLRDVRRGVVEAARRARATR